MISQGATCLPTDAGIKDVCPTPGPSISSMFPPWTCIFFGSCHLEHPAFLLCVAHSLMLFVSYLLTSARLTPPDLLLLSFLKHIPSGVYTPHSALSQVSPVYSHFWCWDCTWQIVDTYCVATHLLNCSFSRRKFLCVSPSSQKEK